MEVSSFFFYLLILQKNKLESQNSKRELLLIREVISWYNEDSKKLTEELSEFLTESLQRQSQRIDHVVDK